MRSNTVPEPRPPLIFNSTRLDSPRKIDQFRVRPNPCHLRSHSSVATRAQHGTLPRCRHGETQARPRFPYVCHLGTNGNALRLHSLLRSQGHKIPHSRNCFGLPPEKYASNAQVATPSASNAFLHHTVASKRTTSGTVDKLNSSKKTCWTGIIAHQNHKGPACFPQTHGEGVQGLRTVHPVNLEVRSAEACHLA